MFFSLFKGWTNTYTDHIHATGWHKYGAMISYLCPHPQQQQIQIILQLVLLIIWTFINCSFLCVIYNNNLIAIVLIVICTYLYKYLYTVSWNIYQFLWMLNRFQRSFSPKLMINHNHLHVSCLIQLCYNINMKKKF